MPQFDEYIAILLCQTWNVWPEKTIVEFRPFRINYGATATIPALLLVTSYVNRSEPEKYLNEETQIGPLIWDGVTRGLHRVRNTILKAPEDKVELAFQHRNAQRGEVDICINFRFEGEIPPALLEAARATASAIMSLVNLQLQDYSLHLYHFTSERYFRRGAEVWNPACCSLYRIVKCLRSKRLRYHSRRSPLLCSV